MANFDSHSQELHILGAVLVPITTLSLILRFVARWKKRVYIGLDDWLAVLAYILWIGYFAVVIYMGRNGNGYDPNTLPYPVLVKFLKGFYVSPIVTASMMTAAKFSILVLYIRIFGHDAAFRRSVWVVGILCFAWWVAATLVAALKCLPVTSSFNPLIKGRCINFSAFAVGIEVPNSVLDFVIGGIAIRVIRKLQLNIYQKLGISFIFFLGTLVGIIGFIRVAITYNPERFSTLSTASWLTVQNAFGVICCSLPTYRPLVTIMRTPISSVARSLRSRTTTAPLQSRAHEDNTDSTFSGNYGKAKTRILSQKQNSYRQMNDGTGLGESSTHLDSWEAGVQSRERRVGDSHPMGAINVKKTVEVESERIN